MSLMAIILWALYPLSPWRRLYELARHLLQTLFDAFFDPDTADRLCANPDDAEGIPASSAVWMILAPSPIS